MCQTLAWALFDACATQEAGTSRTTGVQKGLQGARGSQEAVVGRGAGLGASAVGRGGAQTKGWHIQENRWKWRGDKKRREEMREATAGGTNLGAKEPRT